MGTRNFTAVVMNGEMRVCQYCQWDGCPTSTGAEILEFLRDVDIERFKKALENTKITLTHYGGNTFYTGSTKKIAELMIKVSDRQSELNSRRKGEEYLCFYDTIQYMSKHGELTEQEVDDIVVSTRDTGCDILPYIYERSLDKEPLEVFAFKEEYEDIRGFVFDDDYVGWNGVPGCDAQGYYILNLDANIIQMTFGKYTISCSLDALPENIDKEMQVFRMVTDKLDALGSLSDDEKSMSSLLQKANEIALEIGKEIVEFHPELLDNLSEPIKPENFGSELIFNQLVNLIGREEKSKVASVDNLVSRAILKCDYSNNSTASKDDVDLGKD